MNRFKIISMASAAVILITGAAYLLFDFISVSTVLFIASAMILLMSASLFAEQRSLKAKEFSDYIFPICFFILACAVLAAAIVSL